MEFNNSNSHWIDAHIKQYEKSFKKIDLHDRKSEYWRFATPSIWHDKYFNNELSQDKKKLSLSVNINGITESFIRFKDGILDPEAEAIKQTILNMGSKSIKNVIKGKFFDIEIENNKDDIKEIEKISRDLLANPVIENFKIVKK